MKLKLKIDSDANFWLPSGAFRHGCDGERAMYDGWRYYHTVLQRARWDKPLYFGVARHCAHGADLCRGASRHHGARRLAQAARVEDAYGGHGVGVEQNGRPDEHT